MMRIAIKIAFTALLCCAACECEPRPLGRSLNTVDPSKQESYQQRQPKTTARPLYDAAVGSGEAIP